MRWLFGLVPILFVAAGLSEASAREGPKVRSIDDVMVVAEIPRNGDFITWGFDALWMMTGETAVHVNGEWKSAGPSLVRVDGASNSVEDREIVQASASVRG